MKKLSFSAGEFSIHISYAGKDIGNVSPAFGKDGVKNERAFLKQTGIKDKDIVRMNVRGGDRIIDLNRIVAEDWLDCDALVTTSDHGLALYAADCIPLVLWSEVKSLIALVHLGRQGATLGLAAKTIGYITHEYKIVPEDLYGWMGPSIKRASYIFRPQDIAERFPGESWQPFLQSSGGQVHADVMGYVLKELTNAGVKKEDIIVEPVDTGSDEQYFSHYRSKKTSETEGRNVLIVYKDHLHSKGIVL